MTSTWQIFFSFAKIGALLFGGGYAMLPLLEREVVDRRKWCRQEEMLDYYAMAQLVPGVIAINTAMLVGQKIRGWTGLLSAMLGVVAVPFAVILVYAIALDSLKDFDWLHRSLAGLRPAAAGMLLGIAWTMFVKNLKLPFPLIVSIVVFLLVFVFNADTVAVIAGGVLFGVALWGWRYLKKAPMERGEK